MEKEQVEKNVKYVNSNFKDMHVVDKTYQSCDFRGVSFKYSTLVNVKFIECTFGIYGAKNNLIVFLALLTALSAGMFPTFEIFIIEKIVESFDVSAIKSLSRQSLFIILSLLNSIIICILIYSIYRRKIVKYIYFFIGAIILSFFLSIIFYGLELIPYMVGLTNDTRLSTVLGSIVILFAFTLSLILIMSIIVSISGAVAMSIGTPSDYRKIVFLLLVLQPPLYRDLGL